MKFAERLHQKAFEDALTDARDKALWKQIVAKYPADAKTTDLSDEDAEQLVLLQRRKVPETLTLHGQRQMKTLPSNFKPPSAIRDESVSTELTLLERLADSIARKVRR